MIDGISATPEPRSQMIERPALSFAQAPHRYLRSGDGLAAATTSHFGNVSTVRLSAVGTVTSSVQTTSIDTPAPTLAGVLAKTPPSQRFKILFQRDPIGLGSIIAGVAGAVYALVGVIRLFMLPLLAEMSMSARADTHTTGNMHTIFAGIVSSRDPYEWMVTGFMGAVLVISVVATLFLKNEKKIDNAQDITKILAGALLGTMSTGSVKT